MLLITWLLSFSAPLFISAQHTGGASLPPDPPILSQNTGFYCHIRCIAKCIEENKISNPENEKCSSSCTAYHNDRLCEPLDRECWSTCKDLVNETGQAPKATENVTVGFASAPEPSPSEAELRWGQAQSSTLYLVQYVQVTGASHKWKENIGNLTVSNPWRFRKPSFCSKYAFRVAAVNRYGVGPFSSDVILPEPSPTFDKPSYNLSLIELLHTPFTGISPNDPSYNTTVRLVVSFAAPIGWNLTEEIIRIEPNFHAINLPVATGEPVAPYIRQVTGTDQFEILLPGDIAYTDTHSEALFSVEKLYTACNPGTPIEYPKGETPFLFLRFNCADVRGGSCPAARAIPPDCNLDWANSTFTCINGTQANATVHFSNSSQHVLYYVAKYGPLNPRHDGSLVPLLLPWQEETIRIIPGNETSFEIPGIQITKYYETSICAVFDNSTFDGINWNITRRFPIEFPLSGENTCVQKEQPLSSSTVAVLVIAIALVLLVAFIILACLYAKMRHRHTKALNEKGGNGRENGYVDMPRLLDRWEMPRAQLTIYDDQKLGSGAFGAVYKGKIRGKALMSKNAQSVLAENRMAAEDCDVAVKMLPEYADEGAKSEFRKEINLMKQLGQHERLVNMVCCITVDEPLCLIVEYCSEGDLLHYLRERCKYMVKLQEQGLDLCNIPDDYDVDINYILSMKDLLMFAWQICVGLEYLSEKNYIHRDVAARNVMVDAGKRAKIGDFGLCRYSCSDPIYMGKGGRLPWKWMALEAIKNYEFTTKSDVWSYGVLLFEIITLGGSPYPGIDPSTMEKYLDDGNRLAQPDNCPDDLYGIMLECWQADPEKRPTFTDLRDRLSKELEGLTEDYSYLHLNQSRDYYNVSKYQYNTTRQYPNTFGSICDDDFDEPHSSQASPQGQPAGFSNPVFGSEDDRASNHNHTPIAKSKSVPVHWDARRDTGEDNLPPADIISSDDHGILYSTGSDQTLKTSSKLDDDTRMPKFFKLKPAVTVDKLDTFPEISSNEDTTGTVNPAYMEQDLPLDVTVTEHQKQVDIKAN